MMYPCLEIRFIVFVKGYFIHPLEISLHKNNSPGSPDKDTPLTGSCYNTQTELKSITPAGVSKYPTRRCNKN